jgi:putative phage-type endonuclease
MTFCFEHAILLLYLERYFSEFYAMDDVIDTFVSKYHSNAKQRSEEWYTLINSTIGGSDMSVILGLNPYKSVLDMARERSGHAPAFTGNLACWWGTIFEDVIARMIELDCNTTIKGADITITDLPGIRFSPDGYCVVRMHYNANDHSLNIVTRDSSQLCIDGCCDDCKEFIALVEIKCPMRRKITADVPVYYTPQVLSGLCFSPIADFGMFVECVIRKRSLGNVFRDPYVSWGIVAIYGKSCPYGKPIDLGASDYPTLTEFLCKACDGTYGYVCSDPQFKSKDDSPENADALVNDLFIYNKEYPSSASSHIDGCDEMVAFMPWMSEELHYKFVDRQAKFVYDVLERVRDFHTLVDELKTQGVDHPLLVKKKSPRPQKIKPMLDEASLDNSIELGL